MNQDRHAELLGQIYDASFDPDLWVPVMEQLASELSADTACMTMLDVFTGEGGGYTALVPENTMAIYVSQWAQDNPLHKVCDPLDYVSTWRPTTLRYEDWAEQRTLHRSSFFNEFLRPIGSENGIMMGLALMGTTTTTMNIARSYRGGVFDDEEIALARRWQEHLARAVRLGHEMRIAQAAFNAIDQLVESTRQCLFFLDVRGRIRRMTSAAEAMLASKSVLCNPNGVLTIVRSEDDCKLRKLITQAGSREQARQVGGTIRLDDGLGSTCELSVAPLGPRTIATWSSEPIILVTVATQYRSSMPTELRVRRRFGLTPAEARLALALLSGNTLREVADDAALSINTVRAQLSTIFSKTGCRRQADLVRTLLGFE